MLSSTPTIKSASRIEAAWLASNQQSYWVPCPPCEEHQVLRWENPIWAKAEPERAQYCCEHCSKLRIGAGMDTRDVAGRAGCLAAMITARTPSDMRGGFDSLAGAG